MNVINNILKAKPREESGSKTSKKYDYQKDLSLYLMILHHAKGNDYAFLFDCFEDLTVLNLSLIHI